MQSNREQYNEAFLGIILNDQAYRDAKSEIARWEDRKAEAERNINRLSEVLTGYDNRLVSLASKINRISEFA